MPKQSESSRTAVKLFSLMTCSHCKAVKTLLTELGVEYELIQVDLLSGEERNDAMRELKYANPLCTFPTLMAGDIVVVGHKESEIRKAFS